MDPADTRNVTAHAAEASPAADPDGWWEVKRAAFGGDDGVVFLELPFAEGLLARARDGRVCMDLTPTQVEAVVPNPARSPSRQRPRRRDVVPRPVAWGGRDMAHSPGALIERREIRHFHLFCGLGGGARGFNRGSARVGSMVADFRCLGGIDVDPASIRDFGRLAGVPGTVLDLFDREQYEAFHGARAAAGLARGDAGGHPRRRRHERPHIVFLSAPCKGFSGLLSESKSQSAKYQALNKLTLRGIFLLLEAYKDDLPELLLFENVPAHRQPRPRAARPDHRPAARLRLHRRRDHPRLRRAGRLGAVAQAFPSGRPAPREGAAVPVRAAEALAARRWRRARPHAAAGRPRAGPMHRVPSLHWQTWVRLAFVEAGSDWRSLSKLAIDDGMLRDFALQPDEDWRAGVLGVRGWADPSVTVAGRSTPTNGAYSVADPRWASSEKWRDGQQYGVRGWKDTAHCIAGSQAPGQGAYAVADPRHGGEAKFNNCYRVVRWGETSPAVTGWHRSERRRAGGRRPPRGAAGMRAAASTASRTGTPPAERSSRRRPPATAPSRWRTRAPATARARTATCCG